MKPLPSRDYPDTSCFGPDTPAKVPTKHQTSELQDRQRRDAVNSVPLALGSTKLLSRRLHRKQAAIYLGTSLSWLDKTRLKGDGPVYLQIGGRVVYDIADLDEYMARCRRQSTSEQR